MKRIIRLTESDLRNIVRDSVKKAIRENARKGASKRSLRESEYWDDDDYEQDELTQYPETFDEVYNDGKWQVIMGGDGGRDLDKCYYINHPAKNYRDINKAWQYWDFLLTFSDGVRLIDGRGVDQKPISLKVLPVEMVQAVAEECYDFEKVLDAMAGGR